ncbi:hypothetical protein OG470_15665 [Micromonospora sp. NBC_00389]|uniref:hypothetical protein n=1 Tax=Micromonospora sp. NBC_00389 TaxID=2903586 RepID=UPI002E24760C
MTKTHESLLDAELRGKLRAYLDAWSEGQITAERALRGVEDALQQRGAAPMADRRTA